jgi:hypothetical protein
VKACARIDCAHTPVLVRASTFSVRIDLFSVRIDLRASTVRIDLFTR